jgi:type IV pilus assembly protein PilF
MKNTLCLLVLMFSLGACASNPPTDSHISKQTTNRGSDINVKLGLEYMRLGQYKIAMEKLQRGLELDPRNAEGHHMLALLYQQLGETQSADYHFKQAVELDPKESSAHNNYGKFLCQTGKNAEAEEQFLQATSNPLYNAPELAYTNAAVCFVRQRDLLKAEQYLEQALRVNPNYPVALYQAAKLYYDKSWYREAKAFLDRFEDNARQTPQSLWLGVQIGRDSQDRDMEASYALLLKGKFPGSEEAKRLNY